MTGEQSIGWLALVVQVIRYGAPFLVGAWLLHYGARGLLRMLAP